MKRLIKYAALLFALILSASIIGGCLTAGVAIVRMIAEESGNSWEDSRNNGDENSIWYRDEDGDVVFLGIHFGGNGEVKSGQETYAGSEIDSMHVEVGSGELILEVWDNDYISVSYENIPEDYEIYNDNGALNIEWDGGFFVWGVSFKEIPKIHVSVPAEKVFELVDVEKGSGSAKVIGLVADTLEVDNGSGGVNISDVTAKESEFNSGSGSFVVQNSNIGKTSMDTGSGFVNFENIIAENLVMDSGSGRVDVSGTITGNCVFESGSGSVNVVIYGEEEDYNFRTDMGGGSFYLNGKKEASEDLSVKHANAKHLLVFDAGSGRVSLEFKGNDAQESRDR